MLVGFGKVKAFMRLAFEGVMLLGFYGVFECVYVALNEHQSLCVLIIIFRGLMELWLSRVWGFSVSYTLSRGLGWFRICLYGPSRIHD